MRSTWTLKTTPLLWHRQDPWIRWGRSPTEAHCRSVPSGKAVRQIHWHVRHAPAGAATAGSGPRRASRNSASGWSLSGQSPGHSAKSSGMHASCRWLPEAVCSGCLPWSHAAWFSTTAVTSGLRFRRSSSVCQPDRPAWRNSCSEKTRACRHSPAPGHASGYATCAACRTRACGQSHCAACARSSP